MSNKNLTGGSFDSGVPIDCFKSNNPCADSGAAGNQERLEQATVAVVDQEGDDPRLGSNNGLPPDVVLVRGQWMA